MGPALVLGIGLLAISPVFFVAATVYYQDYLNLRSEFSQENYQGCLGCPLILGAAEGRMNGELFFGTLLLIGGASSLTYGVYAQKKQLQKNHAETSA